MGAIATIMRVSEKEIKDAKCAIFSYDEITDSITCLNSFASFNVTTLGTYYNAIHDLSWIRNSFFEDNNTLLMSRIFIKQCLLVYFIVVPKSNCGLLF